MADHIIEALGELLTKANKEDVAAFDEKDSDAAWIDGLLSQMPDLEKQLRAGMRREAAEGARERQRQQALQKISDTARHDEEFRRRGDAAQHSFHAGAAARRGERVRRTEMASEFLRARDARLAEEGRQRAQGLEAKLREKERRDAAATAVVHKKNALHAEKVGRSKDRVEDRERRRLAAAVRRQSEVEKRNRERR